MPKPIDISQVFYIISFAMKFSNAKLKVYYYETSGKRTNEVKTKATLWKSEAKSENFES